MLKVKSNNKSNLTLLSVNQFQVNLSSEEKIRLSSMKLQYNHNKQVMKETDLNDTYITNSKSKFFGGKPYNAIIETSNTYRFVYSTIKNNKTIFKSIYIWKNDSKFHNLDKISTNIKLNKQYK